jgi:hypothetical protein
MRVEVYPNNVFASGDMARMATRIANDEKAALEKGRGLKVGAAQFAAMRAMAKVSIGLDILERLMPAGNA